MLTPLKLSFVVLILLTNYICAADRPNVLLILVDDLKPALGCYGDPIAKSPNIDALAKRGMRFDLAYCNQAVCAPSRFTLMLGSHSTSTGLYGLGSQLRKVMPNAVTMPQHFARQGYRTESLGKVFHIGHGNLGDPDSFSVPHFAEKVIEYVELASTDGGKLTREEAFFTNQKLGQIRSLPRGAAFESPEVDDNAYADGRVASETMKRLQAAKQRLKKNGTLFFIAVGFARPHLPFSAPQKYWDMYERSKLPLAEFDKLPLNSPRAAHKRGGEITNYKPVPADTEQMDVELKRNLVHGYYASVSYVDAQIGKVIAELDRLKLAEDTIVVLWGDHGFHLGDLGIWTKHTNYEQANRIPILVAAPGITKPGSSTKQPAESVDIFPTLSELAGIPAPQGPQPIDGKSLVPVLRNPSARVRDHAYHAYPKKKLGRAIRTERYRLVQWDAYGKTDAAPEFELYDYEADPLETENLAEKKPEVVAHLRRTLAKYPEPFNKKQNSKQSDVETPKIAGKSILITVECQSAEPDGVVIAQGGNRFGYAIHFQAGQPSFDIRLDGKVTRLMSPNKYKGKIQIRAELTEDEMRLSINDDKSLTRKSPGLIPEQPQDGLSIARDDQSAAGDYTSPNPFNGTITKTEVKTK